MVETVTTGAKTSLKTTIAQPPSDSHHLYYFRIAQCLLTVVLTGVLPNVQLLRIFGEHVCLQSRLYALQAYKVDVLMVLHSIH